MSDSLVYDGSFFNNTALDATARVGSAYYTRSAVNVLNASLEKALSLGTLTENATQLDVTAQVSKSNTKNFYSFDLNGDSLKLDLTNYVDTANLRVQLMDSKGKVIADSSEYASETLTEAYSNLNSSDGLDVESGTYYVKVSFDLTELKSTAQSYQLSLYSGTTFVNSYATTAASQVKSSQHVAIDNTMTFSTLDALEYSNEDVHRVNATVDDAINIGWLYENKTALSITSTLTEACDEDFYSVTVQKGDSIKISFDNKTDTSEIRIQLMDPTGTFIYADTHGTDEQKAAYEELASSSGLDIGRGQYIIKTSYAAGEDKTKDQSYNFKVYCGDIYTSYYETAVATETAETALINGTYTSSTYSPLTALASYLEAASSGEATSVMDVLASI